MLYNDTIHRVTKMTPKTAFNAIKNERKLNIDDIIKDRNELYDEMIVKIQENKNKKLIKIREDPPQLEENDEVLVRTPGLKNKTQPKFQKKVVQTDQKMTFIDKDGRKIHKDQLKRIKKLKNDL